MEAAGSKEGSDDDLFLIFLTEYSNQLKYRHMGAGEVSNKGQHYIFMIKVKAILFVVNNIVKCRTDFRASLAISRGKSTWSISKDTSSTHPSMLISFTPASGNAKHMDFPDSMSGECSLKSCLSRATGTRRKTPLTPGGRNGKK